MINTIKYVENQNKTLLSLIEKKDREIEEFKLEFGNIERSNNVFQQIQSINYSYYRRLNDSKI